MQKLEERLATAPQHEKAAAVLQQAVETSLTRFGQRVADPEKKLLERHQALLEGMIKVTMREQGKWSNPAARRSLASPMRSACRCR